MPAREASLCFRCRELVDLNRSGIAICIFLRTFGIEDALRSPQEQVACCAGCADVIAKGDKPPLSQPLHVLVYAMIRQMIASDPGLTMKSWMELRQKLGMPIPTTQDLDGWREFRRALSLPVSNIPDGEILPPSRALKAAV